MGQTLVIVIIAINIFAILLNLKMLKGLDNAEKAKYIIIGEILLFIITLIIYQIGSIGKGETVTNGSRFFLVGTFLAANSIIASPLFKLANRASSNEIQEAEFKKKMITYLICGIIIIVSECFYISTIQNGIVEMSNSTIER